MLLALLLGGCGWDYEEIASGGDLNPDARPALADDGTVIAVGFDHLVVHDGSSATEIDLAPSGFELPPVGGIPRKLAQVQNGDVVFVANRSAPPETAPSLRGAYHVPACGGAVTTLFEGPLNSGEPQVGFEIALSPKGTVAFSQIQSGAGALYRGPAAGPVSVLRTGNGTFFNTGRLDVNDSDHVVVQMEYADQGLQRALLVFDTPEQDLADLDTAFEKMGVGSQPRIAMNKKGKVAFRLPDITITIEGVPYSYEAGVYTAEPTPWNTPKSVTLIAGLGGPYCGFGSAEINDAGSVVFEAQLDGGPNCGTPVFDGIYKGPDPSSAVVERGDPELGDHRFFDNVVLGELNNRGDVSFSTTLSEPLVDPVKVWRASR